MNRAAAINFARVGAQKLWAGTVNHPCPCQDRGAPSRALGKRDLRRQGACRMRWGDKLQFIAEAGPGDFIYVPPYFPPEDHASETEPLECVLVRSDNEAVAINIDITPVEKPEEVYWVTRPIRTRTSTEHQSRRRGGPSCPANRGWLSAVSKDSLLDSAVATIRRSSGSPDRFSSRRPHGDVGLTAESRGLPATRSANANRGHCSDP